MAKATKTDFGELVRRLRTERDLTLRNFAKRAGMRHPNVAAIESGRSPAGQKVATRLADALQLHGAERCKFLATAACHSKRDRIVSDNSRFPPWSLNTIPEFLRRMGVSPDDDATLQAWHTRFSAILAKFDDAIAAGDFKRGEGAFNEATQSLERDNSIASTDAPGPRTSGPHLAHHSAVEVSRTDLLEWMSQLIADARIDGHLISELGRMEVDRV